MASPSGSRQFSVGLLAAESDWRHHSCPRTTLSTSRGRAAALWQAADRWKSVDLSSGTRRTPVNHFPWTGGLASATAISAAERPHREACTPREAHVALFGPGTAPVLSDGIGVVQRHGAPDIALGQVLVDSLPTLPCRVSRGSEGGRDLGP